MFKYHFRMTDKHSKYFSLRLMTDIDFQIADTLEKIQHINPEVYGLWYSKLYPPHVDINNWTMETLAQLNDIVK